MGTPVASVAMDLERFCATSRVVIVAGKGGVGKTTVTAALATAAARTGMSVLIVEVEGKSGLAACFGEAPLTYEEAELRPGVRARTLTPDDALLEYLDDHGMRRISRRLSRSGALDVVATAVPGMRDILVLGKVKQLERAGVADLIVIDAPAAGHAVSFLLSARGLLDAVKVGPIQRQAADVVEMLDRPGALPGAAGHAPRGDAGQRAGRHRLRGRGPGRRRAGPDRGERLRAVARPGRRRGARVADVARRARRRRHARRTRGRRARAGRRVPRRAVASPGTSSATGWPNACRSRSSGCRSSSPPMSARAEVEILADELTLGIAALDDVVAR